MAFEFISMSLPEVVMVKPQVFGDERGFFAETYQRESFVAAGISDEFVQDNHSFSTHGVLRGMHFQLPPFMQGKLVSVIEGEVWDVAVDVRCGSPTFGKWVGAKISGENHCAIWIPPGFAHGFVVLSEKVHFVYKCTAPYNKGAERGFRWDDPAVAIAWPTAAATISARDQTLPLLAQIELPPYQG